MGLVSVVGLVGLISWVGLEGLVSLVGIFFLFDLIQKYFQMEILSFMIQKKLEDPQVSDSLKVISNGSMDFNDPKELDDPRYSMIPGLRRYRHLRWSCFIPISQQQ